MRKLSVVVSLFSLLFISEANASVIGFTTTGVFSDPTGACTSVLLDKIDCGSYTLQFIGSTVTQDIPVGFKSTVNYGKINVTGNPSSSIIDGSGLFSLDIEQFMPAPTGGSPFSYHSTLNAILVNNASASYLQFTGPFDYLVSAIPYNTLYSLTEADEGILGRVDITGLNNKALDINGQVSLSEVPEPASLWLLGTGTLFLCRQYLKRKKNK